MFTDFGNQGIQPAESRILEMVTEKFSLDMMLRRVY